MRSGLGPGFKTIILMMINPAAVLKSAAAKIPWIFSICVSAVAFALFFLQTALDLYKTGQKGIAFVVLSAISGVAYGSILIPFLGAVIWLILKIFRTDKSPVWAISTFCLSYSGALVYGALGIIFSLVLGWRTAVAFGVTGVLWATGPIISCIREMTGGKTILAVFLSVLAGITVLFSWSIFGSI